MSDSEFYFEMSENVEYCFSSLFDMVDSSSFVLTPLPLYQVSDVELQ